MLAKWSNSTFFLLQVNCNTIVGQEYSNETRRAMSLMSEKDLSFDLIDQLLKYIAGLGIPGAVLIFLPGWNLIFALQRHLKDHPVFGKYLIQSLNSNG